MEDARKLSREALQAKREQVVQLYLEKMPILQIAKATGLSWPAVRKAIDLHLAGEALQPAARGRKQGTDRILTLEQEAKLQTALYTYMPWQVRPSIRRDRSKLYLWDRDAVHQLIQQTYQIDLSTRCIGKYLERWGFPKIAHLQRPYDRCSLYVREQLDPEYPRLMERSKQKGIELFWLSSRQLSFGKGELTKEQLRFSRKFCIATATDNRGKTYWRCFNRPFGDAQQIAFLETLLLQTRRYLILIREGHLHYREAPVREWLNNHKHEIEFFPPIGLGVK